MPLSSKQISFVYNRPPITLLLAILFAGVTSCFAGIFVTLAYIGWLESFVKIRPILIFFIASMGIFAWSATSSLRGWFWSLSVDNNHISLKPFIGQRIILNRKDIQKFEWDEKKVTFSTVSEQLKFHFNSLPLKSKVEFFNLVPTWLPLKALPPEMQTRVKEVEKLAVEPPPNLPNPVRATASLKHTLKDQNHVVVVIMVLIFVVSVIYGVLSILGFGIVLLITILVCFAFAGAVSWSILNKHIEISNEGIGYQVGFRKKFFLWDDIETIAIQPYQGQITVWINGRYSRIPLVGLNPEQLALFEQAFSQQVYARKIPFGYA